MAAVGPVEVPRDFRRVIIAAAVGNVIEWYDFYIFGSLAAVLSVKFFEQAFIWGGGPRVAEAGDGRIPGFGYSAPFEDLRLKEAK